MNLSWTVIRGSLPLALGCALFAQSAAGPTFEAATVKRTDPGPAPASSFAAALAGMASMHGGPDSDDPERINYSNAKLRLILVRAYDVPRFQIFGPDWIDSDRFEIAGKIPPGATKKDFQSMLQNLLAERFRMKTHWEMKTVPVYALAVQKSGLKLDAAQGDGGPVLKYVYGDLKRPSQGPHEARIVCKNMTMADFAERLGVEVGAEYIDRKVVDDTR